MQSMILPDLIRKEDIIWREPIRGDFVMYTKWDMQRRKLRSEVGIVLEFTGNNQLIVNRTPRLRETIMYVLTLKGYKKQLDLEKTSNAISTLQTKFLNESEKTYETFG